MTEREKVVQKLAEVIAEAVYPDRPRKFMMPLELAEDALALLKAQDERYKNLVISWLDEIAINNVDCNDKMMFLDAVDDIRGRASYGLKQYFHDK